MQNGEAGAVILMLKVEIIIHKFNIPVDNQNGNETERRQNINRILLYETGTMKLNKNRIRTSIH